MAADGHDSDEMSAISPEEAAERQRVLDDQSAEFDAAIPYGVIVEGVELYSDGTYRPLSISVGTPRAVVHYTIATPAASETEIVDTTMPDIVPSGQSTPRRAREQPEIEDELPRSVSPRLADAVTDLRQELRAVTDQLQETRAFSAVVTDLLQPPPCSPLVLSQICSHHRLPL